MKKLDYKKTFNAVWLLEAAAKGRPSFDSCFEEEGPYLSLIRKELVRNWVNEYDILIEEQKEDNPKKGNKDIKKDLDTKFRKTLLPYLIQVIQGNLFRELANNNLEADDISEFLLTQAQVTFIRKEKNQPLYFEDSSYSVEGLVVAAKKGQQELLSYIGRAGLVEQINKYLNLKKHLPDDQTEILLETIKRFRSAVASEEKAPINKPLGLFITQLRQAGYAIRRKKKAFSTTEFTDVVARRHGMMTATNAPDQDPHLYEKAYVVTSANYKRKLISDLEAIRKKDAYKYDTIVRGNQMSEFYYRREMIEEMVGAKISYCKRILGSLNTAKKKEKPEKGLIKKLEAELEILIASEEKENILDFIWLHEKVVNRWLIIGKEQLARKLVPKKFRKKDGSIVQWYFRNNVKTIVDGAAVGEKSRKVYSAWRVKQLPAKPNKKEADTHRQ